MPNASYLRVTKSETRDLADQAYRRQVTEPASEWTRSNSTFFIAFVAIAAVITLLVLLLR